jgi:hypothetical protein
MQNISLGDYKGGRDTLQGALGEQYTPLNEIMNTAMNFGNTGLASIGKRLLEEQTADDTLHNVLAQKGYEDQLAQEGVQRKIAMEGEAAGGEEDAMIAHAEHMFSLLSPEDQAKNAGWLAGMKANRGRGTPLERIGRNKWNSEHGTDEATSLIKAQAAAAKKVPTDAVPLVTPASGVKKTPSSKHKINVI